MAGHAGGGIERLSGTALPGSPDPGKILVNLPADEEVASALAEVATRMEYRSSSRSGGMSRMWVEMALQNAKIAITARRTTLSLQGKRQQALAEALGLESLDRIECFDISHTRGGDRRLLRRLCRQRHEERGYRRFNIVTSRPATTTRQCARRCSGVTRRSPRARVWRRTLFSSMAARGRWLPPRRSWQNSGSRTCRWSALAKRRGAKAGAGNFDLSRRPRAATIATGEPGLHLIQEVRDEGHRFAVSGHRAARGKARRTSTLEEIGGVGPRGASALITHFGGLRGIVAATVEHWRASGDQQRTG